MPETIGPYELRGELGRGAMAVVWRAWDPRLEREVAIKEPVVPAGLGEAQRAEFVTRFVREGKAAAALNHPGIVTIYGADIFDDRPAIVMELIRGTTLGDLLAMHPLEVSAALSVLDQLLDAVRYAHEHGVVHRDLKPDNVFVTDEGRVKLADFGIARIGGESTLTQAGTMMGTPGYMAPEQVRGESVGPQADLFAVGAIAYEMLAGVNPFGAHGPDHPTAVMYRIVHEEPAPLSAGCPAAPVWLCRIVERALAKEACDRYDSAQRMREDLRAQAISLPAPAGASASRRPPSWLLPAGAAALLVVAVAVAGFALRAGGGRAGGPPESGPESVQRQPQALLVSRGSDVWVVSDKGAPEANLSRPGQPAKDAPNEFGNGAHWAVYDRVDGTIYGTDGSEGYYGIWSEPSHPDSGVWDNEDAGWPGDVSLSVGPDGHVCAVATDGSYYRVDPSQGIQTGSSLGTLPRVQYQPDLTYGKAWWSPDGQRVAFLGSTADAGKTSCYVCPVSAGSGQDLAPGADFAAWAPDSKRLVLVVDHRRLVMFNADGNELRTVYEVPNFKEGDAGIRYVGWSPDGQILAFDCGMSTWVVGVDGSGAKELTLGHGPIWVPYAVLEKAAAK